MSDSVSSSDFSSRFSQTNYSASNSDFSDMDGSTVSSTPSRRGMTGVEKPTWHNIKPFLREDVTGNYTHSVKLVEFTMRVWGIDSDLAAHILSVAWTLLPEALETYIKASREEDMYDPFTQMANVLVAEAAKVANKFKGASDETRRLPEIFFWNASGRSPLDSVYAVRKPDMLTVDKAFADFKPLWSLVRHIIEFKRNPRKAKLEAVNLFSSTRSASSPHHKKPRRSVTPINSQSRRATTIPTVSSRLTASATDIVYSNPTTSSITFSTGSQKRKNDQTHDGNEPKRRKADEITNQHLQLAAYALECLDASTRHFVSGVWIDRCEISLWYFDRARVISTETFNFVEEPEKLALVLYALSVCDDKHAGFDTHLKPSTAFTKCPTENPPRHWQDIVGYEFNLPPSSDYPNRGRYCIEQTLFAYRGLIGRGTMVYQVKPLLEEPRNSEPPKEDTYSAGRPKEDPDISKGSKDGPDDSEALKVAWPLLTRQLEAVMISHLRSKLPERWRNHIPDITYAAALTAKELNLPRVGLLDVYPSVEFEDRLLHILGMKLYHKLWEVGSPEAFQEVFIDCVECHYHAYSDAKVLHRDLSENNLMFKQNRNDTIKGILNDWDMASFVDDNEEIQISTATHRMGTIPFMACDLLSRNPPPHLYRHDLESFFYVLVWAAMHYDFINKQRLPIVPILADWDAPLPKTACAAKNLFLTRSEDKNELDRCIRSENRVLLPWVTSLWTLFSKALRSHSVWELEPNGKPWDIKTNDGHITFHTFMAALGRKPR